MSYIVRFLVLVAGVFAVIAALGFLGDALVTRVNDNLAVDLHLENAIAVVPLPPAQ